MYGMVPWLTERAIGLTDGSFFHYQRAALVRIAFWIRLSNVALL